MQEISVKTAYECGGRPALPACGHDGPPTCRTCSGFSLFPSLRYDNG